MRRLTRRIGLFGGPAALMPAMGVKKPPPKENPLPPETAAQPEGTGPEGTAAKPARKSWFRWPWSSN